MRWSAPDGIRRTSRRLPADISNSYRPLYGRAAARSQIARARDGGIAGGKAMPRRAGAWSRYGIERERHRGGPLLFSGAGLTQAGVPHGPAGERAGEAADSNDRGADR